MSGKYDGFSSSLSLGTGSGGGNVWLKPGKMCWIIMCINSCVLQNIFTDFDCDIFQYVNL